MAAAKRVGVLFVLLVCGVILLGAKPELASARGCPLICKAADYMICESTGEEHLSAPCNCCMAEKGCTIYYSDGTSATC